MVLDARATAFVAAAGAWGRSGWTTVILERAKLEDVREMMRESWRLVAPKRMVTEHEVSSVKAPRKKTVPKRRR